MAPAFATPVDLDLFMGRSIPTLQATIMLAQASALIRSYCGWHLYPSTEETLTVDGSGAAIQSLPTMLLSAVDSVTEDGVELDSDDYEWSGNGFLRRVGCWTTKLRGVAAAVTHGYAEVPMEVAGVCLQAAARAIANPSGVKSEQSGGTSVNYAIAGGLNDGEKLVLERHRLPQAP